MSWRTCLLVAAVASCWSVVQLERKLFTITRGEYNRSKSFLCCFYNELTPKPWHIQIMFENSTLETEPVDDFTICNTIHFKEFEDTWLEFRCIWPDNGSTKAIITPFSFLEVNRFQCIYSDITTDLQCTYNHRPESSIAAKLNFSIDNTISDDCMLDEINAITTCSPKYPHIFRGLSHNFTIEHKSFGILRKLDVQLTDRQMKVPYFPTDQPHIEVTNGLTCADFAFNKSYSFEWTVVIKSYYQRFTTFMDPISYLDASFKQPNDVCFSFLLNFHQEYSIKFEVRFNYIDAPWTSTSGTVKFYFLNPTFLPLGFFYYSKKNELHVFWGQENEGNFDLTDLYSLATSSGEKPLHKGKRYAVFTDWKTTEQATVLIRSKNLMGLYENNDELVVPALTNFTRRQPRNLRYHFKSVTLTWDPPEDETTLSGYYIYWCSGHQNNNKFCDKHEQLKYYWNPREETTYHFEEPNGHLRMAVSAIYDKNSSGGMKWYVEPSSDPPRTESTFIVLSVVGVIFIALLLVAIILFSIWRRKKIAEFQISLPPIFDEDMMAQLSLRNVHFPRSRDPPEEVPSTSTVPQRILSTKIVELNSAHLARSPDPPVAASSSYTTMDELPKPKPSFTYS